MHHHPPDTHPADAGARLQLLAALGVALVVLAAGVSLALALTQPALDQPCPGEPGTCTEQAPAR